MEINQLSSKIIQAAIKVHSNLGPGLLESAYQACLFYELCKAGLKVQREKPIPVVYDNVKLDCGYRADLIIENTIIVELKAIETLHDIHLAQMLTYLKLAHKRYGLLINFNVQQLRYGIKRVVNGY